ncbi:MAG TPA: phosphoribosyltransferase family protein [Selenomonadales bacterium]|nr:phosphoribosyltransferase family protein [Selenomonadales bacterium]
MYEDRLEAGQVLAELLAARHYPTISLLAVPRGGIMIAAPIARRLGVRLEVLVTRKISHPANPEVAVGAVMADGSAILDDGLIATYAIPRSYLEQAIAREYLEIQRRMTVYAGSDVPPVVQGRTAIVVDDGIATGYTVQAAVKWLKKLAPERIIVAVPVAPPDTVAELAREVDEMICPLTPEQFMAVGLYYRNFAQNTDDEVLSVLRQVNNSRQ